MAQTDVIAALQQYRQQDSPCALVILVDSEGSVPAKPGAKMLVAADGNTIGTVGGGGLEQQATEMALDIMTTGTPRTIQLHLTEEAGYACGGHVSLYLEPILPAPRLIICGAGHVGQALCHIAAYAGFAVTAIDDREEFLTEELLPQAQHKMVSDFTDPFNHLNVDEHTYIVICTRGHTHDFQLVEQALVTSATYIGMLGSRSKRTTLIDKLIAAGLDHQQIEARLHTPVGLDIGGQTPREIAVSIVAQLIAQRRCHGSQIGGTAARSRSLAADGKDKAAAPCAG
ncbi:MAG: XdhC/CoxI family protein [Desulfuromonadaceae bacterium]